MPIYNFWNDTQFYAYAAAFAGSLAYLAYAIKRWLEIQNAQPEADWAPNEPMVMEPERGEALTEPAAETPEPQQQADRDFEKTMVVSNIEEMIAQTAQDAELTEPPASAPDALRPAGAGHAHTQAEEFVKGIYGHMAGIDARLGAIEKHIAEGGGNRHFAVKFLEGIIEDYESLSVEKIKTRVEYLISDLRANSAGQKPGANN